MTNQQAEKPTNLFAEGPYVQAAALCELDLIEQGGVHSLIRIVDTVTLTAQGLDVPLDMPPTPYKINLALMLKSGRVKGRYEVRIEMENPSGERKPIVETSIMMEGAHRGGNLIVNLNLQLTTEGLHWFNVYWEKSLLTRIPLEVRYVRQILSQAGGHRA